MFILSAWTERVEELKGEVRRLMSNVKGSMQEIELINDLQRLGVAYQFEKEIEEALHRIYISYPSIDYDDLWTVALSGDGSGENLVVKRARVGIVPGWVTEQEVLSATLNKSVRVGRADVGGAEAWASYQSIGTQRGQYLSSDPGWWGLTEIPFLDRPISITRKYFRWDEGAKNQLPGYMQVLFQAILDTMEEIAGLLTPEERSYRLPYLKEALKLMCKCYVVEQRWFDRGYVPPLDEYLRTSLRSSGHLSLTVSSFGGMGEIATKESFEWAMQFPKVVRASCVAGRLLDDIQSREFEQKRGHVASGIDCYVKEYGVSEEEACAKFRAWRAEAWKDMNEELLKPSTLPMALQIRPIRLACVMEVLYMYADEYTHSTGETKAKITAVLVEPIPVAV
ncbi:hypothetical protein ACLOJK_019922 [Asimina triloba]